jgi:hypothetical protein
MNHDNNFYQEYTNLVTKPPVSSQGYDSLYEWCKSTSNYHFDMDREDQRLGSCVNPLYIPLTRFEGDWADDLAHMTELAKPFSFDLRGKPRLQNNNEMEKNDFDRWGYVTEGDNPYIVFNRAKVELVGKLKKIAELFHLDIPTVSRVDIQYPGQMFYYHLDNFGALMKGQRGNYERFADCDYDQRKMLRLIVFLDDQKPGHIWQQGNMLLRWKKGDCFTWPWRDIPHGTANFGHEPRPTLNITGAVTDRTLEVLKNFPKTFNVDEL